MKLLNIFFIFLLSLVLSKAKELKCDFDTHTNDEYACKIVNQDFERDFNVTFKTKHGLFNLLTNNDDVKQVFFDRTKMSHVPNQIFVIFPNLQSIYFEKNNLKQWKKDYLKGATKLKSVYIFENEIETFNDDAFEEVSQLESLWIKKNKITTVNPNMFKAFSNLRSLNLSFNDLSLNLPLGVFDAIAKTVESINLSKTGMSQIPVGMFKKFKKLESLYIEDNENLSSIDATLTFPANLKKVFVGE